MPTIKVDSMVPMVAKTIMGPRARRSFSISVCNAPAKSRNPNIKSSNKLEKLSCNKETRANEVQAGAMLLVKRMTSDKSKASTINPMVDGSFRTFILI